MEKEIQAFFKIVTETEKQIKEIKQRFIDNAVRLGIELWNPIDGYSNYEVSSFGRVRSNYKNGKTKILKPQISTTGYYTVNLSKSGIAKTFTVHRLVTNAFVQNPENKQCVDHKNNNRLDNNVNNLRWSTKQENNQNKSISKNNTSGYQGVAFYKSSDKWRVQIMINGKNKCLGYFDNIEDAVDARRKASKKYFGQYQNKCEQQFSKVI